MQPKYLHNVYWLIKNETNLAISMNADGSPSKQIKKDEYLHNNVTVFDVNHDEDT